MRPPPPSHPQGHRNNDVASSLQLGGAPWDRRTHPPACLPDGEQAPFMGGQRQMRYRTPQESGLPRPL